ncbi:MAG: hypothetical protein KJ674_03085 [Nanoarchaeota archaeon]|nr:hypothetical protein [Nanoarchaeota archaeon]
MNKKSMTQHQFLYLFYILFAVLIFVFLVNTLDDMHSGKGFGKEYFARDVGMIIESAYIGNGDLEVEYNFTEKFLVEIKDGVLLLRESKQSSYGSYLIAEGEEDLDFELITNKLKITNERGVSVE